MKSLSNLIDYPKSYFHIGTAAIPSDDGDYLYYYLTVAGTKNLEFMRWRYFLSRNCIGTRNLIRQKWKLKNHIKKYHEGDIVSFD